MRLAAMVGLALALLALAMACGGDSKEPAPLTVTLDEWSIGVAPEIVAPGTISLTIENQGALPHGLVIIKSDLPPAGLPLVDGSIDADAVNIITSLGPLDAGVTLTQEVVLTAGKYLLIDGTVKDGESYYQNGMVSPLLLEDD